MKIKLEKELATNAKALRAWRRWHRECLDAALSGPHAAIVSQVVDFLHEMTPASAPALLNLMRSHDWARVDADTRFTILHEINDSISAIREQQGLAPFDDALPGQRLTAFGHIKQLLFPNSLKGGCPVGGIPANPK